jgi:hypothetical protein
VSDEDRVRPGGRPKRRAREASAGKVEPVPPGKVHELKAAEARGYRWETAAPGNYLGVKSGVGSDRIVSRLAGELVAWACAEFPDLADERYRFAVASWARSEAVVGLIVRYLDEIDVVDGGGELRGSALKELRAAERKAGEERRVLGLTPVDHPRLEKERAEAVKGVADLSGIKAAGRKALEAHRERVEQVGRLADEEDSSAKG